MMTATTLPKAQPNPENPFGVDLNVNVGTIDEYLDLDGVAFFDARMIDDPADFPSIGGESKLTKTLEGFTIVPFPYLGTLSAMPVANAYEGDSLFDVEWGEGLEIISAKPNYTQSMQIVEEIFPKDKPVVIMCGAGGYAGMTRALLIHLGWDPDMIYNIGGQWGYQGNRTVELIKETAPGEYEYYLWRVPVPVIDFSTLKAC